LVLSPHPPQKDKETTGTFLKIYIYTP